jgi:hypothetical protein
VTFPLPKGIFFLFPQYFRFSGQGLLGMKAKQLAKFLSLFPGFGEASPSWRVPVGNSGN